MQLDEYSSLAKILPAVIMFAVKLRSKISTSLLLKEVSPVIKFLIISDVMVVGAAGMLAPLFALFVEGFIQDGNALVISISMGIYLVARSLLQIPIATIIDKIKGETDDYYLMVIFSMVSALLVLLYLLINQPWQLYLVQLALGITTAITYPSYMAIFTRHIDKTKEGTEWGIYYTLTDLGSAILAIIGGYIATFYGLKFLIVTVSLLSTFGSLLLLPIKSRVWSTKLA